MAQMTKAEFLEWAHSPLTRKALKGLKDQRSSLSSLWAAGSQLDPSAQIKAQIWGRLSDLSDEDAAYEAWFGLDPE